jgi:hypothetical protein
MPIGDALDCMSATRRGPLSVPRRIAARRKLLISRPNQSRYNRAKNSRARLPWARAAGD